jgi:hypothetical protein
MNLRIAAIALVFALGQSAADRAEERVQLLVQPSASIAPDGRPVEWSAARVVEQPQLPLMLYAGTPPAPPVVPSATPLPQPAPEGEPVVAQGPMPQRAPMPGKPVIQLPAVDVEKPLPIPMLGQPKQDRASLDDATLEASQAAALTRVRPRRTGPVPFAPVNLPDPFENQRSGGLREPPAESDQPPAVPVRTPR